MILVDTSVWIAHLRQSDPRIVDGLQRADLLIHPFVAAELALGGLHYENDVLAGLATLRPAPLASHAEVMRLIETASLAGSGVGYVDVHLLASVKLMRWTALWTYDRRLASIARGHAPVIDA